MNISFSKKCQPLGDPGKTVGCQPLRNNQQLKVNQTDVFVNPEKQNKKLKLDVQG